MYAFPENLGACANGTVCGPCSQITPPALAPGLLSPVMMEILPRQFTELQSVSYWLQRLLSRGCTPCLMEPLS